MNDLQAWSELNKTQQANQKKLADVRERQGYNRALKIFLAIADNEREPAKRATLIDAANSLSDSYDDIYGK